MPRLPGSAPGKPDEAARQAVTGRYPDHSSGSERESADLRSLREIDAMLFPPVKAPASAPWPLSLKLADGGPSVDASGMPEAAPTVGPREPENRDLAWLAALDKPDIPVRFEPSIVRYLSYYKNDPRGRKMLAGWIKRAGRYREAIVKLLREEHLPEDVLWLALVESAFEPTIHSAAGAAGLWQFVPATGRIYGLTINRRVDERLDPERSTRAALKHLADLHTRFGSWDLAFAAYNMGYGGLLASIRRYNTNDYWELRKLEAALPYETALYVPKILSIAVAARNCKVFGCAGIDVDAPEPFGDAGVDKVAAAPGVTLKDIADAAGVKVDQIAALNPQIIGTRLPPLEQSAAPASAWTVYVPRGKGAFAAARLPQRDPPRGLATYRVRWGEPVEHIAARFATSVAAIERLNDLDPGQEPRPSATIFVPADKPTKDDATAAAAVAGSLGAGPGGKPLFVVPQQPFAYPDRRRVFYQAVYGDTLDDVADRCGVTASELGRWNHLDAGATLQDGMTLQLFIGKDAQPSDVLLLEEAQVEPVSVQAPDFFAFVAGQLGKERILVSARRGDTWRTIAGRYGLSAGMLERINGRSRYSALAPGDKVVVYAARARMPRGSVDRTRAAAPATLDGLDASDELIARAGKSGDADDDDDDDDDATAPAPQPARPAAAIPKAGPLAPATPIAPAPKAAKPAGG